MRGDPLADALVTGQESDELGAALAEVMETPQMLRSLGRRAQEDEFTDEELTEEQLAEDELFEVGQSTGAIVDDLDVESIAEADLGEEVLYWLR